MHEHSVTTGPGPGPEQMKINNGQYTRLLAGSKELEIALCPVVAMISGSK